MPSSFKPSRLLLHGLQAGAHVGHGGPLLHIIRQAVARQGLVRHWCAGGELQLGRPAGHRQDDLRGTGEEEALGERVCVCV